MASRPSDVKSNLEKFTDISHIVESMRKKEAILILQFIQNISPQDLEALATAITENEKLEEVRMNSCAFGKSSLDRLARALKENKKMKLKLLELEGNLNESARRIGIDIPDNYNMFSPTLVIFAETLIQFAAEVLNTHPSLLQLNFSEVHAFLPRGARVLGQALRTHPQLLVLNLNHAFIRSESMKLLIQEMIGNKSIQRFLNHGNYFDETVAGPMAQFLQTNRSLVELIICNLNDNTLAKLAPALKESSLQRLHLESHDLTAGGIILLAAVINQGTIQALILNGKRDGGKDKEPICQFIKQIASNKTLTELDLSWIGFTGNFNFQSSFLTTEHLNRLAEGCLSQGQLKKLSLRYCDLISASALANSIPLLNEFDISGNKLDDKTICEFARVLPQSQIKTLNLGPYQGYINNLNAIDTFIGAMRQNTSLLFDPRITGFGHYGNRVVEERERSIREIINRNRVLRARQDAEVAVATLNERYCNGSSGMGRGPCLILAGYLPEMLSSGCSEPEEVMLAIAESDATEKQQKDEAQKAKDASVQAGAKPKSKP